MSNGEAKQIVKLVEAAVEHSNRLIADDMVASPRASFYRKEMRTLRLKSPRRFGLTSAAAILLKKYPDAILIVPNSALKNLVRSYMESHFLNRVFTASDIISHNRGIGQDPRFIILDVFDHFVPFELDTIYKTFVSPRTFWVELG